MSIYIRMLQAVRAMEQVVLVEPNQVYMQFHLFFPVFKLLSLCGYLSLGYHVEGGQQMCCMG